MIELNTLDFFLKKMPLTRGQKATIYDYIKGHDINPGMSLAVVPPGFDTPGEGPMTVEDIIEFPTSDDGKDYLRVIILAPADKETTRPRKVVFDRFEDGENLDPITLVEGKHHAFLVAEIDRKITALNDSIVNSLDYIKHQLSEIAELQAMKG